MYTVMQYHCVTVYDELTKQDETFFDVANLKNILTVFVFTSYNVFKAC